MLPAKKIKIEAPHGPYSGLLEMDTVYFISVDRVEIQTTHPDAVVLYNGDPDTPAENCKINPNECADGSVEAHVRHATSPSWKTIKFTYTCELRELKPGQIELGSPSLKEGNLLIGSHDSICDLTPALTNLADTQVALHLSREYQGHGISFAYPEGWQVQEGRGGFIVVAPADAHRVLSDGKTWMTLGLMAGFYQPSTSMELAGATEELVRSIQQANPELRRIGQSRQISIASKSSLLGEYVNAASRDGIFSKDVLLTVKAPNGVWYWLMGCPADQSSTYLPLFSSIMRTIQIGDAGDWIAPAKQVDVSFVYVEPSKTLVRGVIGVNAGQAIHYNFGLERRTKITAEFQVEGGLNNKVEVYLLDSENFQRYAAKQQFSAFPGTSGTIRGLGKYEFDVPQTGLYYVVIDNGRAWLLSRQVTLYLYEVLPHSTPESIKEQQVLESTYQYVKQLFIFPDFRIFIRHCGVENAFSDPNITLCRELMDGIAQKGLPSAIEFVFAHELGHTLLRVWGIPLWDNEDAADEFATMFMILTGKRTGALQAAQWWAGQDVRTEDAIAKIWLNDRHSLSPQRARNIIHWLNDEQERMPRWQKVMIPNMQTDALRSLLQDNQLLLDRDLMQLELKHRGAQSGNN